MNNVFNILKRKELISTLVARELKSRYKGSVLGFLWSILTPLFMAFIYVFFLRLLAGRGVPMEEIIIGVFAWQFTAACVNSGMNCITGNSNLVKKVFFPRMVLPISITLASLVNFLLSLMVQFAIILILTQFGWASLSAWSFAIPLVILYHTMFNLSVALLLSSANVYFRDTQHLVGVLLSAWFFMTPVMYNLSFVEKAAARFPLLTDLYLLNPMALIITGYRALILKGAIFPWTPYTVVGLAMPFVLFVISCMVFERAQRNFADML